MDRERGEKEREREREREINKYRESIKVTARTIN